MNIKNITRRITNLKEAIVCIIFGTVIGLLVYEIFLILHIDIFGWNLGLIFAPLIAGYAETLLAQRLIGEDIGAISAFILFAITTFYSFILKNPTLGVNIITAGSIVIILQAAFPTVVNYILLVLGLGILSYVFGIFKKLTSYAYKQLKHAYYTYILKKPQKDTIDIAAIFNESESNKKINSLGFYFITSTDIIHYDYKNLGQFHTTVIVQKDNNLIQPDPKKSEREQLNSLKQAKDDSLIRLSEIIKEHGGNGVVDLEIQYSLIGLGGDSFQISAMGMGIKLN